LRAVLQTVRDRLPVDNAVHFGAQLPLLIQGLYCEGWEPSKGPIKNVASEFLATVKDKIVTDKVIDPIRITGCLFEVISSHVAPGDKLKHCFPKALQTLWPQQAAAS